MSGPQHAARIRHEKLADELATGKSIEQAMLAAGYQKRTARAGRIRHEGESVSPMDHPDVRDRVTSIREEARKRASVKTADIADMLKKTWEGAMADQQFGAASSAAMNLAKVLGLVVTKQQHEIKPIEQMTEAELLRLLGESPAEGS